MNNPNSIVTQLIKLPVDSNNDRTGKQSSQNVTPVASNLAPASKRLLGKSSKAQLVALVASVPLFSTLGYGAAKNDLLNFDFSSEGNPKKAGSLGSSSNYDSDGHKGEITNEPKLSIEVTDDQPFSEAFTTARQELGAGNYFIWKGNIYSTHVKEEWESLSDDKKAEFISEIPYDKLPDYHSAKGHDAILISGDHSLAPGSMDISNDATLRFSESGHPILNDEQIELVIEHYTHNMSNVQKMDIMLKVFNDSVETEGVTRGGLEDIYSGETSVDEIHTYTTSEHLDDSYISVIDSATGTEQVVHFWKFDPVTGEELPAPEIKDGDIVDVANLGYGYGEAPADSVFNPDLGTPLNEWGATTSPEPESDPFSFAGSQESTEPVGSSNPELIWNFDPITGNRIPENNSGCSTPEVEMQSYPDLHPEEWMYDPITGDPINGNVIEG
jgi:hypothetical protein